MVMHAIPNGGHMAREDIPAKVTSLLDEFTEGKELEIYNVIYKKEGPGWVLRVFLDKPMGAESEYVSIEECEEATRYLSDKLDELDIIDRSYNLEVSSPGLERELKQPAHFQHFLGEKVAVKLFTARGGRREYVGVLRGYEDGTVLLETTEGEERFGKKEYAAVRLYCEY